MHLYIIIIKFDSLPQIENVVECGEDMCDGGGGSTGCHDVHHDYQGTTTQRL